MAGQPPRIAACLAVAGASALIAACGGGGSDAATVEQASSPLGGPAAPASQQPLSPAEQQGRDLFVSHCGSCHTFAAAGTVGQIGPNLADISLTEADIKRAIRIGGGPDSHGAGGRTGNMPPHLVTGKDARDVAAFVAANASGGNAP